MERELPESWAPAPWDDELQGIAEFLHDIAFWTALIGTAALILLLWSYT